MTISSILKPLKDIKPVTDFIKILDLLSSDRQHTDAIATPSDKTEDVSNHHEDMISDLRLTNKLLYYQVSKFETVLDNLNDGIMLLDSANRVFAINHIMEQLVNLKRGEVKGKHIKECPGSNGIFSFILENVETADKLVEKTIEINTGMSSLRVSFKMLIREDGNPCGSLLTAKDITAQKLADNARIEFLSNLSYELTTPENLIRSYSEKLHEGGGNCGKITEEFFDILGKEVERLSGLVNNILHLSRIEVGELPISKSMVRTREFIEDVFNRVISGNKKDLKMELQIPEDVAPVSIDKKFMELAIANILNNAICYTPEHGTVRLTVENGPDDILIHITDTGVGISEDDITNIFNKFYRSSDEIVKMYRGSGLGLSLSKHIVDLHEGEIRVSSRKGEGSRFTIVLPVGQGYFLE